MELSEISANQGSQTKNKKVVHHSNNLTPKITKPSIPTLIEEFKKVIVEKFERKYRNMFIATAIFATMGQLGFQIRCKKTNLTKNENELSVSSENL